MNEHAGHLFVVHGRIESVIHDAALIPVDAAFNFNPGWRDLVGASPRVPPGWDRGYGRMKEAPDRVWAVSTGDGSEDYAFILDRIVGALERVDKFRDSYPLKRGEGTLPLVALPVIGIGLGGYSEDRGKVLHLLVERLTTTAKRLDLDIALVTPDPAVYAAAQYARRKVAPRLPGRLEESAVDLANSARSGHLALLLGAGVSAAAGLPGWGALIEGLERRFGMEPPGEGLDISLTDRAELIERVDKDGFKRQVAELIKPAKRPSLPHVLLAGLDCHQVVTTNYDVLYEAAVFATGKDIKSVMPWASAHGADRWILKLHGDVDHPEQIVLTRRHMVRYDAANRPSAAVLQSLLLTKRLLAVGVSMTDDNVIRLAHEVDEYRVQHQKGGTATFGTVLDSKGDKLRGQLWDGQLDWINLPDEVGMSGFRALELVLDRIAFHAARTSSWLLDERFDGLLNDREDAALAADVRALYDRMSKRGISKWAPLVRRLEELGVQGENQRRLR
ncbi:SIR2 family protein [Nocardioides sp. Soil805]|uniref:SIR2 family protein n=1 Tax=Nocardioides sp. Soil805 TaxID=1736416 RepID=UPI0012E32FFB|nr:SIR2 family protein [Nocardioides sp. Soil805]